MPNQDHWFRMELGELVQDTASSLAANYNRYYPKAHSCDPNERDLTIAFGSALTKRRYAVFNEVPVRSGISGNREDRIDLLAIASTNNHAILVESKNIFSSKQRATVVSDFSKMHGFSPAPRRPGDLDFPETVIRMALCMSWTEKGIDQDPFLSTSHRLWLDGLKRDKKTTYLNSISRRIERNGEHNQGSIWENQWLICLFDEVSIRPCHGGERNALLPGPEYSTPEAGM